LGSNDLNTSALWAFLVDLSLKSIWETWVEGGTTGEDDVSIKVHSDIDIAILDGGESHILHTESLISLLNKSWVEESLWGHESWGVDGNNLTIWELVVLGELSALGGLGLISLWIEGDEADSLFD